LAIEGEKEMQLSKMRVGQCFTVYTYKVEQKGALQIKILGGNSITTSSIHNYQKLASHFKIDAEGYCTFLTELN
jgi:hypothetical protein